MLKRLAVLFAILALVAAACSSSSDGDDATTTTAAAIEGDTAQAEGDGTLAAVIARGKLICGVSGTAVGFSETQADGSTIGFDADYCRAVAAAVLGDAEAVEFRALTAAERFEALKNNEIDVLIRNTTWTQSRDTDIGMQFIATTFYDGQQIMGTLRRCQASRPQAASKPLTAQRSVPTLVRRQRRTSLRVLLSQA